MSFWSVLSGTLAGWPAPAVPCVPLVPLVPGVVPVAGGVVVSGGGIVVSAGGVVGVTGAGAGVAGGGVGAVVSGAVTGAGVVSSICFLQPASPAARAAPSNRAPALLMVFIFIFLSRGSQHPQQCRYFGCNFTGQVAQRAATQRQLFAGGGVEYHAPGCGLFQRSATSQ